MLWTPIALEGWGYICENIDYIIGLTNLKIATTLPGQAMQNVITSFISTWNKEVVTTSDWLIDISMLSTIPQLSVPWLTVSASKE